MTYEESILDKIISTQQANIINEFDPKEIVISLIQPLSSREMEVITLRHGLDLKGKKTLEKIGNQFNVTRERIRQIENSAIKKIKKSPELSEKIGTVKNVFQQTLEKHGGIMPEELLLEKTLSNVGVNEENKIYVSFILSQLLSDQLNYVPESDQLHAAWKLPSASVESLISLLELTLKTIKEINEPVPLSDIHARLVNNYKHQLLEELTEDILLSYLHLSKYTEQNPYKEWGMADWNTVTLKKISDKVYLVLKKEGQPLHFTAIADKINETGFDQKIANPATIHNELILDDKYVLVGRGMYALSEWGYKPGTVAEVITDILKNSEKPLSKNEIIAKVLENRLVKKSTIILALMDKSRFTKTAQGHYALAANATGD